MNSKQAIFTAAAILVIVAMAVAAWKRLVADRALPDPVAAASSWWKVVVPSKAPPNLLVGSWLLFHAKTCDGQWVLDEHLKELIFEADGTFSVTQKPFCTFRDAWGTYVHDRATGHLSLKFKDGNHVPTGDDFDGEGTAVVELGHRISAVETQADRMILEGIVLFQGPPGKTCAMALARRGLLTEE